MGWQGAWMQPFERPPRSTTTLMFTTAFASASTMAPDQRQVHLATAFFSYWTPATCKCALKNCTMADLALLRASSMGCATLAHQALFRDG